MRVKWGLIIAAGLLLSGSLALGYWRFRDGGKESPYLTAPVQMGDVTQVVSATGTLQAVVTV
ncbi:MAG: hypothetical protein HYV04_11370, partial [Deltaproteobacteria bacterium]|nr:hypothetical protein [Deltaproteobacteria bacterium]